jgi:hypothetical protein
MVAPDVVRSGTIGCRNPASRIIFNVKAGALGDAAGAMVNCRKNGEHPMKVLRAAAVIALLTGPAYAQMPNINLIPEIATKSPEEKEADAVRDKAYRDSLKKIPDAKVSSDPWGTVRADTPKTPAKPRTKTGSTAN